MKIACLGWGSLVWSPGTLPVETEWSEDGPDLPVEYCRQSRDNRVTLVIVPSVEKVRVLWCTLRAEDIEVAVDSLAKREVTKREHVGYWTKCVNSKHYGVAMVAQWAACHRLDGVVWTALPPKWDEKQTVPADFEVVQFLRNLDASDFERAKEYIVRTPGQIKTRYRKFIQEQLGWKPHAL